MTSPSSTGDFTKMAAAAEKVSFANDLLDGMRKVVEGLLAELPQVHQGDAATVYQRLLADWLTKFAEIHGQWDRLHVSLGGTAKSYEASQQASQQAANQLAQTLNF